jgi:2',3'-cyclic-nucleotide 2'-phosphodiesterase/3'-nucleotidase
MNCNNRFYRFPIFLLLIFLISCVKEKKQTITILETTDVHGVILPYDFIEKKELNFSLANAYTYIKKVRKNSNSVLLLDNGDNLQGQPDVYFYNFIDTTSPHLNAEVMNFMGYDAGTVGNHDIEAGHSVYDRLAKDYRFPLLAANAVDKTTGKPYFKPYEIFKLDGIKIAVMGLITPAVPNWLPPELYSGIEFRDMVETAKLWMPVILNEKPDIVVGLFHSGWDNRENDNKDDGNFYENGSASVAMEVSGFDIILNGHDHKVVNEKFVNSAGDTVLILDGGSRAEKIARADIIFSPRMGLGKKHMTLKGKIVDVDNYSADPEFIDKFRNQKKVVQDYVNKIIATSETSISSRDSYFGSSPFVDMIHLVQLEVTHADISFTAPLSFDVSIPSGPVTVGDMFKLYRFDNILYTMSMTGSEIKKYLEFSYSGWLNTMTGPNDNLLKFRLDKNGRPLLNNGFAWLKNQPYNFDSAAGIDYLVDASKPDGEKVTIKSLSTGAPFVMSKTYTVAVNSHRGNGGGGHLNNGAGISKKELQKRLLSSTDRDLRYYILKYYEEKKTIKPLALQNWKIIPEDWVKKAGERDYRLLFGK